MDGLLRLSNEGANSSAEKYGSDLIPFGHEMRLIQKLHEWSGRDQTCPVNIHLYRWIGL